MKRDVDNAQFSCSICLELLRDPVTIPCGHSYCMSCLTKYWDRQGVCNCPQCRRTQREPTLHRENMQTPCRKILGVLTRMQTGGVRGNDANHQATLQPSFIHPSIHSFIILNVYF
uniref:RING-type domain-containing protein n=1 Tax=Stegastes partitus TaxID=144197 RepID=A0A3B5AXR1_9TELE